MEETLIQIGSIILTFIIGYISGKYGKKYSEVKSLFDKINSAIEDDSITEDELNDIYNKIKEILDKD